MTKIAVLLKGFTSGMHPDDVLTRTQHIINFYSPQRERVLAFSWDGDPQKDSGSTLDEQRGTPGCFTGALPEIRKAFPEIPLVAFKRVDQLDKLNGEYVSTTKHGSVEVGYDEETFGPVSAVCEHSSSRLPELSAHALNVVTAPSTIKWDELGIINVRFWKTHGVSVHYVTIGGGAVVTNELSEIADDVDMLWRLPTSREAPKAGAPTQMVPFRFATNDDTLPFDALPCVIVMCAAQKARKRLVRLPVAGLQNGSASSIADSGGSGNIPA